MPQRSTQKLANSQRDVGAWRQLGCRRRRIHIFVAASLLVLVAFSLTCIAWVWEGEKTAFITVAAVWLSFYI